MNILHLSSEYPPQQVYGLGRFVRDLAEEQAKQGHFVIVITNSLGGEETDFCRNGVRILRTLYPPAPKPPTAAGCLMVFNILILRRIVELGATQLKEIDVICSHDWLTAPAGQAISEAFGVKHICTFHDVIWGKRLGHLLNDYDHFAAKAEAWAVHNAHHVIANSSATKQELLNRYAATTDNISVVPCALAPHTFCVTNDRIRLNALRDSVLSEEVLLILYVGRLDQEKGLNVLFEAVRIAQLPAFKLVIAGQGTLLGALREFVEKTTLRGNVEFLGYVENPVLANLYACADMLVCPSLYEPFGMVALEGMLQGIPVIASDVGGLSELIENGKNGLLVPPNDSGALANALSIMAQSEENRQAMGKEARRFVLAEHTWDKACLTTTGIYSRHVGKGSGKPMQRVRGLILAAATNDPSFGAGRFARDVITSERFQKADYLQVTSASGNEGFFSIESEDRIERKLIQAFQMAAKLLHIEFIEPNEVICFDWNAALAAFVIPQQLNQLSFIVNPMSRLLTRGSDYEWPMNEWSALVAKNTCVFDERDKFLTAKNKSTTILSSPQNVLPSAEIVDKFQFRAVLTSSENKLIIVALRFDFPFDAKFLLDVVQECFRSGDLIHWIVCGMGNHFEYLMNEINQKSLPVTLPGYVSYKTLTALLSVSDAAFLPFKQPCYTPFIDEVFKCKLPIIAPLGTCKLKGGTDSAIHEMNSESLIHVVTCVRFALELNLRQKPIFPTLPIQLMISEKAAAIKIPSEIVLYNNWGLGDELLLSAVAREMKQTHPYLKLWIRSRFGFSFPAFCESEVPPATAMEVETIYQNVALYGPKHHSPFPGHLVQQMLDKVFVSTGIRVTARNVRPELQLAGPQAKIRNKVVLHCRPNGRLPSKDWGMDRWITLCNLLHKNGIQITQVGSAGEPKLPFVEDLRGLPPAEVCDIVGSASLVICLVGFLMHVAAATNTKAVVVYGGREHPLIDGYPDHIHVSSEALSCRGRWGCHLGADEPCLNSMRCMDEITPELVFRWAAVALNLN